MKRRNNIAIMLLSFILFVLPAPMFAQTEKNITTIDVLSFNDFHGAVIPNSEKDKNLGASKLVAAIDSYRKENKNTLVVSAGDNFTGTAISNLLYGEPVSQMMKQIGIVTSAIGNHEFDWGIEHFKTWEKDMNAPWVAANIIYKENKEPVEFAKPYVMEEIDGVKIAFVGLTTVETAFKTKPENVVDFEFLDPKESAEKWSKVAKDEGADLVILLTHIGSFQNQETGVIELEENMEGLSQIPSVDGIITGHSHQKVAGFLNDIPVVQGLFNGRAIGKLQIEYDKKNKQIVSIKPFCEELYLKKSEIEDDPATALIMQKFKEEVDPILGEIIAHTKEDLTHDRYTLSTLGQWTSEVMKEAAKADIAVTNGGGLRTDIFKGDITIGNLYEVMPFDNVLTTVEMNGKLVKEIFEHGIDNKNIGSVQFAGVQVYYMPNAEIGKKVQQMILSDGREVQENELYTVVTNDFMATGGDGFTMFKEGKLISETEPIRESMADAFRKAKVIDYQPQPILFGIELLESKEEVLEQKPVVTEKPSVLPKPIIPQKPVVQNQIYIVKPGDVLWKIAQNYSITWQELATLNRLKNPHKIYPGQNLIVPAVLQKAS